MEWVQPREIAGIDRAASEPALRIVFPHDGDVFVLNPARSVLAQQEQQLPLEAVDVHRRVRWSVGGVTLPVDAAGQAFWPLRVGTWRIDASDGLLRKSVTIRVAPTRPNARPGFTRS
jgi:hypothetical protein